MLECRLYSPVVQLVDWPQYCTATDFTLSYQQLLKSNVSPMLVILLMRKLAICILTIIFLLKLCRYIHDGKALKKTKKMHDVKCDSIRNKYLLYTFFFSKIEDFRPNFDQED